MRERNMTFADWCFELFDSDIEALEDSGFMLDLFYSSREVFDAIVLWHGGLLYGWQIRSLLFRVYDFEGGSND